jgi:nicotinate-nucleotide adenylyltransferase
LRIGVFGGTFDPIHRTHVDIGRAALDHKRLDKVLFVVSADPPHKGGDEITPAETRYAMVEAALKDEPGLEASAIELRREGPSYTADTLDALRRDYPDAEFYLIIGQDALIDLPRWRAPEVILRESRLLVLPRPGLSASLPTSLNGHYEILPFAPSDLSSTDIRQRILEGDAVSEWLPPAVLRIVKEQRLYHAPR